MRRTQALVLAAGLGGVLALAGSARPQDQGLQPYFWPHRTVGIPVDVDQLGKLANRPSDIQLYYAVNRGGFQKGPKLPLNGMQALDGGKRGFLFTAERDGDFEFTVQFIYPDGTASPRADDLAPQQRIILDTTPPVVKVYPSNTGVEWVATDDNLDTRGVTLQCKYPASPEWTTVTERGFRTSDRYNWQLPPGKVLEVRVQVRDKAGNEGVSPIVRVPPDAATGVGLPRTAPTGGGPEWVGGANLPQPRIDYVNTLEFDVDYTVHRMGRSGVKAAHLFVLKSQGGWEFAKKFDVKLMPADRDQTLSLPYRAKEEGTYGFYVIPESGAGKRAPDPKKDDSPMVYVVVDTTPPFVKLTGVQVKPGGTRGPVVEFTWEAADPNLMPQPISLEWSLDQKAAKWNEVKYRLDNNLSRTTGRYVWEVPDENLWKFYVRIRAVDKASNTGEHIWGQDAQGKGTPAEVIVDLESPAATINRVRGGNSPSPAPRPPAGPGGSDSLPRSPAGPGSPAPATPIPPALPGLPDAPGFPTVPMTP